MSSSMKSHQVPARMSSVILHSSHRTSLFGISLKIIVVLKGVPKKTSLNLRHRFCLISLAKNTQKCWDIIYFKGDIYNSVWSNKLFCKISGSRDISKSKWGIRFLNKYSFDNLVSWNLMSHIDLFLFRLHYALQKLVWASNMSKDVTFRMGHFPAF